MKEVQAILHVKRVFFRFDLLIFLSEYGAMSSLARKLSSELSTRSNTNFRFFVKVILEIPKLENL